MAVFWVPGMSVCGQEDRPGAPRHMLSPVSELAFDCETGRISGSHVREPPQSRLTRDCVMLATGG